MQKTFRVLFFLAAAALVLGFLFPPDATAVTYKAREGWMFGVGVGYGRGTFENPDGERASYRDGAVPQIRTGYVAKDWLMPIVNYQDYIIEFDGSWLLDEPPPWLDDLDDTTQTTLKLRRSLQSVTFGFSFFPGSPEGPSGGIFLRVGAGMGWTGSTAVPILSDREQGHGERIEEWGVAFDAEGGYEFWISDKFTAGLAATANYFDIGSDRLVNKAWYTSGTLILNWYSK